MHGLVRWHTATQKPVIDDGDNNDPAANPDQARQQPGTCARSGAQRNQRQKCSIATLLVEEHGHEEWGKDLSDRSRSRTNFNLFNHRMGLALRVTAIVLDGTDEAA